MLHDWQRGRLPYFVPPPGYDTADRAGAAEEEYTRLMRATDPWRVTELKPIAQTSIFLLGPVYIATLAVQQLVPALFNGAYAIGAAVLLGPLLFQILTG